MAGPAGPLKAAGAAGLLLGLLGVPLIGPAALGGVVLFVVGAVLTQLSARNYTLGVPVTFLALAAARCGAVTLRGGSAGSASRDVASSSADSTTNARSIASAPC